MNGPNKRMPQKGRRVSKVVEGGLYVAPNGMCKISTFAKEEESRVRILEGALREEQIIERDEGIQCLWRKPHLTTPLAKWRRSCT